MMKVSSIIILKLGSFTIKAYVILFVFFHCNSYQQYSRGGEWKDKIVYCGEHS